MPFQWDAFSSNINHIITTFFAVFIDIPEVVPHYDLIQLATYDFQTPDRNPYEADYPAPIYDLNERIPENNVNYQVTYWLGQNVPASKLHVCIPTFGRTWKLEEDSTATGVPPIREVSLSQRALYNLRNETQCILNLNTNLFWFHNI